MLSGKAQLWSGKVNLFFVYLMTDPWDEDVYLPTMNGFLFMENVGKYIPYMDAMGTPGITFR